MSLDHHLLENIREIVEKHRIHEVLMNYCRGVDRNDVTIITASFHTDAQFEYAGKTMKGSDSISEFLSRAMTALDIATHMVCNEIIELDGDTASSELYFLSSCVLPGKAKDERQLRVRAGRYLDRLERRNGEWKISSRIVVQDWCKLDELHELPTSESSFREGKQGRKDPLYELLATRKILSA